LRSIQPAQAPLRLQRFATTASAIPTAKTPVAKIERNPELDPGDTVLVSRAGYENLGYPSQYFNDRLIEVIDDMLKAPDVQGPIELIQPRVFYEYKDRDLEARSAGQKLLIRMGPANAAVVKTKLRELRSAILEREKTTGKHG